jgi:ADP-heptose:LPS heptosyltransferase
MNLGKNILLLVSERIGDAIFCTPALALLKQQRPASLLAILAPSAAAASVFEHNPAINHIYSAPDATSLKKLAQHYDCVIDLHNNKITRRYSTLLKLPTYRSPRIRAHQHQSLVATEFIAGLLNCTLPAPAPYLLYPQPEHFIRIQKLLDAAAVNQQTDILIGCHMGCSQITRKGWKFWKKTAQHKSWPVENFITLAERLKQNNPRIRFVLTGSASESHLCRQFTTQVKHAIDLSGKTSVLELSALMHSLNLFLTGDTGPLHIACATNKPIAALFGPTSPIETGPYPLKPYHQIIQGSPIEVITVDAVYEAINNLLAA